MNSFSILDKEESTLNATLRSVIAISRERDYNRSIDMIVDMGHTLVKCDRISIWLIDKRSGELWTKVAQGAGVIKMPLGHGIVGEIVEAGKSEIINDPYSHPRFNRKVDLETGYLTHSILVIPMFGANEKVIGAFQALNKLEPGGFDENDLSRLQLAAAFSAKVLDTENLLQENNIMLDEQRSAAQKQQSIIVNEFESDDVFESRTFSQASEILSGDTYALYRTGSGDALLYIVDGMGHGILPSLTSFSVAGTIKQSIYSENNLGDLSVKLLKNLQVVLTEYEQLSCAFFWLSADMKYLDYFVAGFYPPIVQDSDQILQIKSNNLPLMNITQNVKIDRIELKDFKKMFIYTDGLVEDANFNFSRNDVSSLLDIHRLKQVCDAIKTHTMDDDVTMIYFGKK